MAEQQLSLSVDVMNDEVAMKRCFQIAEIMAQGSATVPKHLQGNAADCMAVSMQAAQWGMNPYAVAQKTALVNGSLSYEAQLVNAVISSSRAIQGRFHYEYTGTWPSGKDAAVRVGAMIRGEDVITWGEWLFPEKVTTKNSPLWKSNPKQQASYLALKYWSRLYTPSVILGVYTSDEMDYPKPVEKDITPQSDALKDIIQEQVDIETGEIEVSSEDTLAVAIETISLCQNLSELKLVFSEAWRALAQDEDKLNELKKCYEDRKAIFTTESEKVDT